MKRIFCLLILTSFINFFSAQNAKDKNSIKFCNTQNKIFRDSLDKCYEFSTYDPAVKIMSFYIKFEINGKQNSYNVLGNALTPEVIKLFKENYRSVNDVDLDNIMVEKDGKFFKLSPARFFFVW